jgi:hypothetical protein
MGKLLDAIKKKYRTPEEALQALGLDKRALEADQLAGDSKPQVRKDKAMKSSRTAVLGTLALAAMLRPRLAQDAKLDLRPVFKGVTDRNFVKSKPLIIQRLDRSLRGKLARDATIGEVAELLDMIDSHGVEADGGEVPEQLHDTAEEVGEKFAEPDVMDASPMAEVEEFLKSKLDEEDLHAVLEMLHAAEAGEDEEPPGHAKGEEQLKKLGAADDDEDMEEDEVPDEDMEEDEAGYEGDDEAESGQEHRDNEKTDAGFNLKSRGKSVVDRMHGKDRHAKDRRGARDRRHGRDEPPAFKGMPKVGGGMHGKDSKFVSKVALDASIRAAVEAERGTQKAIRDAEREIRPWVGQVDMSFDSAEQVYRHALKMLNVSVRGVHQSALPTILRMQPKPGDVRRAAAGANNSRSAAMDGATPGNYADMFPEAKRIRQI